MYVTYEKNTKGQKIKIYDIWLGKTNINIYDILKFSKLTRLLAFPYPSCILLSVKTVCLMLISFEILLLLFKISLRWRDTCSIV